MHSSPRTLYVAILPLYVMGMIRAELFLEKSLVALVMVALGTILIHVGAGRLRHEPEIVEEDLEGYDDDFQLLGLS
jgi:hypothetical protein